MCTRTTEGNAAGETRFVIRALLCLLLLLAIPFALQAQQYSGTITGTVTDTSGAAIDGATVTATNTATNAISTAKTNSSGSYTLAQLPVGSYTVQVEQNGFKTFVATLAEVHVSSITSVDAKLEVGAVTEKVTVQADAIEVQTNSAVVGEIVSGTQVRELPLNGENFVGLTQLSPGVNAANSFNGRDKGLAGGVDFSVNGNPYTNNLFLVDGVNNNDVGSNRTILVYPSVDTIAEFKMIRNSYGPEYGQASGAIISITTKSGANQWHGGMFYAGRNDALNANDWFSNHNNTGKAELRRNDWGYNISGPVVKNKLFIWWNQEWNREIRGTSEAACVPTVAEKTGDFSQGASCGATLPTHPDPNNPNIVLPGFDPSLRAPGSIYKLANPNPAGVTYAQFYPDPNVPGATGTANNWAASIPNKLNWSEWNVRADYDFNKANRATFRWTQDSWTNPAPNPGTFWGDSIFPTVAANWSQPSKSVMGKLTSTISNTMVNDVEFGYGHNAIITSLGGSNPGLVAQIAAAIPPSWPSSIKQQGALVQSAWGGLQPYGSTQTIWNIAPYSNHEDLYTIQDNLSKVWGNHTFKVGAFYGWNAKIEDSNGGVDTPQINAADGQVAAGGFKTGNQLANLLVPNQLFNISENSINATAFLHWHDFEWYFGDSWKIRRNVTIDYGFRWSFYREPFASNNGIASFNLADYNPKGNPQDACNGVVIVPGTTPCATQAAFLNTLGISLPLSGGTPGVNSALVNQNNHDIAPRVGIAWDIFGDGKTALRAGGGQFFQRELVGIDEQLAHTAPFVINATAIRTLNTAASLSNPSVSPNAAKDPRGVTPNSWQWNASIEQEFKRNMTLQVGYVGNSGVHLTSMNDLNQVPYASWTQSAFTAGSAQNAFRPAGNFGMIGEFARQGHASYNALQVLFKAQTGNYSTFQAAYTWSHSIGNVELDNSSGSVNQEAFLNNANPNLDKGSTNINRPNIFVFNEVLYLPKFSAQNGIVQAIAGNWQVNSIGTLQQGTSLSVFSNGASGIGSSTLSSLTGNGFSNNNRPLVTGVSCNQGENGDQILNPAAFTLVGYALGTTPASMAPRGYCSGPHTYNFDIQFAKSWYIKERVRVKFAMDMFNIFNHANFNGSNLEGTGFNAGNLICGRIDTPCSPTNNLVTGQQGNPNANFGQSNAVHPGRELQYSMKFTF